MEENDVYRRKIWHENLDLINNNLSNMLSCIYELESTVNKVGQNQDRLITLVEFTNDICTSGKKEPIDKKRPDITFPKFPPCLASFDIDPPNIIATKSYKRRKWILTNSSIFPFSNCILSSLSIKTQYN